MTTRGLAAVSSARRRFLAQGLALAAAIPAWPKAVPAAGETPALIENRPGGYRFLPGGAVFNSGALPLPGHEIVHVLFSPWVPLDRAWGAIESAVRAARRTPQAVCGMELRIPRQLSFDGFRGFNAPYIEQLRKWDLIFGEYSAVSRTNVAPLLDTPDEPSVHAFSYATPSDYKGTTFCVSGTADIDPGGRIIAQGDVSQEGMRRKLQYVIGVIGERLGKLGLSWADATHTDLCLTRDIGDLLETVVVPGLQGAAARGLRLHFARPPIVDSEVELETRGVHRELVLRA
ncbi:MAG: 2-amino-5-chloromuconate deaminase CnbZ [Burkholderiales bacterium]